MNRRERIRGTLPVIRDRQAGVDEMLAEHIGDRKTSCHSCTSPGCCYQNSLVQFAEAVLIAHHLVKEKLVTTELKKKLRELGTQMESLSKEAWFAKAVPCVFLTEDKRCSIYEIRPISCRAYYVVSPVENCQPPEAKDILQIDMRAMLFKELEHFTAMHLFWGLRESSEKVYMRSLPMAVYIALKFLEEPTLEVLNKIKWPAAGRTP